MSGTDSAKESASHSRPSNSGLQTQMNPLTAAGGPMIGTEDQPGGQSSSALKQELANAREEIRKLKLEQRKHSLQDSHGENATSSHSSLNTQRKRQEFAPYAASIAARPKAKTRSHSSGADEGEVKGTTIEKGEQGHA